MTDKRSDPRSMAERRFATPDSCIRMAIRSDGSFCGTIGGGCGEAEVRSVAMEVLETGQPRLVTVDLTDPIEGEDRICGGVMEVFIERIAAGGSRAAAPEPP
jgi:xanthine/CO dehydrogenase XdhC/CoxF family maturation factor